MELFWTCFLQKSLLFADLWRDFFCASQLQDRDLITGNQIPLLSLKPKESRFYIKKTKKEPSLSQPIHSIPQQCTCALGLALLWWQVQSYFWALLAVIGFTLCSSVLWCKLECRHGVICPSPTNIDTSVDTGSFILRGNVCVLDIQRFLYQDFILISLPKPFNLDVNTWSTFLCWPTKCYPFKTY